MNELNELQVVVNQEVGAIHWNFEELKTALAAEMKKYEGIVYDDNSIADVKKDIAFLRKLRTSVEDRRKEVKEKCLEPYKKEMEPQAKELVAIIDKPILELDSQAKAYEEDQKRQKKKEILNYMDEKFAELPEIIASKLKFKIYDSKWENKTTGKKIWQSAVDAAVANIKGDLSVLDGVEEDFLEEAKKVYGVNLVLSEALCKVQELRRQKEMILERERQRREAEEAAKREKEAAAKREVLARQEEQKQEPEKEPAHSASAEPRSEIGKVVEGIERHAYQQAVAGTNADPVGRQPGLTGCRKIWTIQIRGSEEQYLKTLNYIKFVGAEYREV